MCKDILIISIFNMISTIKLVPLQYSDALQCKVIRAFLKLAENKLQVQVESLTLKKKVQVCEKARQLHWQEYFHAVILHPKKYLQASEI